MICHSVLGASVVVGVAVGEYAAPCRCWNIIRAVGERWKYIRE